MERENSCFLAWTLDHGEWHKLVRINGTPLENWDWYKYKLNKEREGSPFFIIYRCAVWRSSNGQGLSWGQWCDQISHQRTPQEENRRHFTHFHEHCYKQSKVCSVRRDERPSVQCAPSFVRVPQKNVSAKDFINLNLETIFFKGQRCANWSWALWQIWVKKQYLRRLKGYRSL